MLDAAQCLELAERAHEGQLDKGGKPYIDHVRRIYENLDRFGRPQLYLIAAALHDVVEDTDYDLDDLRRLGVPEQAVEAVDALTRRDGELYVAYIGRVSKNPIARDVKIHDLYDNLSLERLSVLTPERQVTLGKRYRKALEMLGAKQ